MNFSERFSPWFVCLAVASSSTALGSVFTFDDLPNGPTPSVQTVNLNEAVNPPVSGNATYGGIVWDSSFELVNSSYKIADDSPHFGLAHSGDVFVTTATDHVMITTSEVLLGAWFGRNVYYGFGNGTDQITVNAMSGATVLSSITYDLPLTMGGSQPEPLTHLDTSSFLELTGITGYRIDRHEVDPEFGGNHWVGDDFEFVPVPETGSMTLAAAALLGGYALVRRTRKSR
ncbi:MAG TPA: hypothetical protein VMF06_18065 [Candidatus Limnocylindria bacterium]|jgi:hypothetical protein|nr:hypothetical protein [Candidatus Limnocylindria bacterium]